MGVVSMKESTSYFVILGILSFEDCSGYDIKKKIDSGIGYFYKISNGQIYPVLKKLIQHKHATFTTVKNDGKPDRKIYAITEQGRAALREWLEEDAAINTHNELLLKLYFGSNEPIHRNIKILEDFKKSKELHLKEYDRINEGFNLSTINQTKEYYSYFTLRYGQVVTQAHINWCDEVISVLNKMNE